MSSLTELQKAINDDLDILQTLCNKIERSSELIERVDDEELKEEFMKNHGDIIDTLGVHVDGTDTLIRAIKKVLND